MDNEQYLETQQQIIMLANLVKAMPLKEFTEAADKADAIGPFVDPTLWRAGEWNLRAIRELAHGLRTFQNIAVTVAEYERVV